MEIVKTPLKDSVLIYPKVFEDERGHFFESYKENFFSDSGIPTNFVQDNQSMSMKGVLRGLHFQKPPFAQGKLVRVLKGKVLDVAVDVRKDSPTYGQWYSVILSEENKKIFWIPVGFAHGFLTLEDNTVFCYKCTNYYNSESDSGILWKDQDLKIDWRLEEFKIENPSLSEKDAKLQTLKEYKENPTF